MTLENRLKSGVKSVKKAVIGAAAKTAVGLGVLTGVLVSGFDAKAADLYVTNDYPTIQSAIDAAGSNDVIHVAPGRYNENLTINNKFLKIAGAGATNTFIHSTNQPLVSINSGKVEFADLDVVGGNWNIGLPSGWFSPPVRKGFVVTNNANVTLNNVDMNNVFNYYYTQNGGTLIANNVNLENRRDTLMQCDLGFQLKEVSAGFNNFKQERGNIDHTLNINELCFNPSDILVADSTIKASRGSYGDGIRVYNKSNVEVKNCNLYRDPADTVPPLETLIHTGVSVYGPSNNVTISGNTMSNLPWAVYCLGSAGSSNKVIIEGNKIRNSSLGGIVWDRMNSREVDLGGGNLGSKGGNEFSHTNPPAWYNDVLFTNVNGVSSANIFALGNTWTGGTGTNKENYIFDKLDNPQYGRLITDELRVKNLETSTDGTMTLGWNERGAGEKYTVQSCSNLVEGIWTNLPGMPVTNSSYTDSSATNSRTKFYKLESIVP
jgi:hypothetical protein